MRLVVTPDLPDGALSVFAASSTTPPEGAATVVANSKGLFVAVRRIVQW